MRIPRIYQPLPLSVEEELQLDENGAAHIGKVLRMQPEQQICLFNGEGGEYIATILEANKKKRPSESGKLQRHRQRFATKYPPWTSYISWRAHGLRHSKIRRTRC